MWLNLFICATLCVWDVFSKHNGWYGNYQGAESHDSYTRGIQGQLRADEVWALCLSGRQYVEIGICSHHFIECGYTSYMVRSCPSEEVFVTNRCVPARQAGCERLYGETIHLAEGFCMEGNVIPSADCETYQICSGGSYRKVSCYDNSGMFADACSQCYSAYPMERKNFPGQCSNGETIPHPQDCAAYYVCSERYWFYKRCKRGKIYDPFTGKCIKGKCAPSTRECRDGERITSMNPAECHRVVECRHGTFVLLQCPDGHIYDKNTNNCVRGQCQGTYQYLQVLPSERNPLIVTSPPKYKSPTANSISTSSGTPEFVASSCYGSIQTPDQYDSSRYWECGPSGKYQSMVCPKGNVYDPHKRICVKGTCSTTRCVEGSFQPLQECGHYKTCYKGEWYEARCNHEKKFFNGRCTNEDCPRQTYDEKYYSQMQCHAGAVQPNPENAATYKYCEYGIWTKRTCPDGAIFDWKVLGCVVTGNTPMYTPSCYEGNTRPIEAQCSLYEECRHGRWERKACPYGYKFYNGYCVVGSCSEEGQPCVESSGNDGYRRVQHDCAKFYQCVHGKWMERPCGPGTVFNERVSICDHPWNVPECGGIPVK